MNILRSIRKSEATTRRHRGAVYPTTSCMVSRSAPRLPATGIPGWDMGGYVGPLSWEGDGR